MNELQIGMIGLGVVAVGGVLAYNKWQESRQRAIAQRVLQPAQADVLLDTPAAAGSVEPTADDQEAPVAAFTAFSAAASEAAPLAAVEPRAAVSAASPPADLVAAAAPPAYAVGGRIEPHLGVRDADDEARPVAPPAAAAKNVAPTPPAAASQATSPATAAAAAPVIPARVPPAAASGAVPVAAAAESAAQPVRAAPPRAREPLRDSGPPALLLSPLIDYVAVIEAADPASAADLLRSAGPALARVRKPVRWFGREERSGEWEGLQDALPHGGREQPAGEYRRLHIGLQLVDRRGPVSDAELAVFQRAMQDLADGLVAVVELAPAQPALVAAASLDAFCADVDIQIGLNVVSQGNAFAGSKLRALAEAAGMALDGDGRFVRRDDDGVILFSLCNQESGGFSAEAMKSLTTHGITFVLDVPRVAHGDRVFAQMLEQARRFAATLQGVLVDDNRRPLAEGTLDPIRRAIAQSQSAMAARQIPAGCPLALRLFS